MKKNLLLMLVLMMMGICNAVAGDAQIAFPGADGYGKYATGGRGGEVYYVTRNDDCDESNLVPGTLRWALHTGDSSKPRTVLFQTSGTIYLTSVLKLNRSNVSILGQTAPGGGVCLAGYNLYLNGQNIIVRHIRFRAGDIPNKSMTGLDMENCKQVIIDHCSMTWSMEESLTAYDSDYTTVQWCIIGEALYNSKNSKGARAYAMQWGGEHSTMHHTLITNSMSRSPRFNGVRDARDGHDHFVDSEFANNVLFNWGKIYGGEYYKTSMEAAAWYDPANPSYDRVYLINNYYRAGPCTVNQDGLMFARPDAESVSGAYGQWYAKGNKMDISGFSKAGWTEKAAALNADNWNGVGIDRTKYELTEIPYALSGMKYESADDAYDAVLAKAGASLPRYDEVDQRLIAEAAGQLDPKYTASCKVAGIIDSPDDITLSTPGEYVAEAELYTNYPDLSLKEGEKYMVDTDCDGMPDAYEEANGLNPNDASDGVIVATNGYTNMENFLNGIADGTLNKADYETSEVMIPSGKAAEAPSTVKVSYAMGDATNGTTPESVTLNYGEYTQLAADCATLYKAGSTLTGWKAGAKTYAIDNYITPVADVTVTPAFTANTEALTDRQMAVTATWDLTLAPQVGSGSGIFVSQVTPVSETQDIMLQYEGDQITVPSEKDAIIAVEGANPQQFTATTESATYTFTLPVGATSISVTYPALPISGTATALWPMNVSEGWAASVNTVTPEVVGTVATTADAFDTPSSSSTMENMFFATFVPKVKTETLSTDQFVSFTFTPTNGMNFHPTTVALNAYQGASGGKMTVTLQQGDGDEKVLESDFSPAVPSKTVKTCSKLNYDVTDLTVSAQAPVTIKVYIYNVETTKKLCLNNINIIGLYDGTITGINQVAPTGPVATAPTAIKFIDNGAIIIKDKAATYEVNGAQK